MATVTIHSDSGAEEQKICHCFHFFPNMDFLLYLNNIVTTGETERRIEEILFYYFLLQLHVMYNYFNF